MQATGCLGEAQVATYWRSVGALRERGARVVEERVVRWGPGWLRGLSGMASCGAGAG